MLYLGYQAMVSFFNELKYIYNFLALISNVINKIKPIKAKVPGDLESLKMERRI